MLQRDKEMNEQNQWSGGNQEWWACIVLWIWQGASEVQTRKNDSNNNENSYALTTCTQFQVQNQKKKNMSPIKLNTSVTMHNVDFFFFLNVCSNNTIFKLHWTRIFKKKKSNNKKAHLAVYVSYTLMTSKQCQGHQNWYEWTCQQTPSKVIIMTYLKH